MATATKKGILNKIKALVAQTGKGIIWRSRPKDNDISEKIAQKIQKSSYDFSIQKRKDTYTPPYQLLVDQLQVDDEQIFRAAVHNLTNIAISRPRYADQIRQLLDEYFSHSETPQNRKDYVRLKISEIGYHKR